ncbi:hypothetical protein [Micromonospora sp. NBC_01412]|uniref:hypothetical protein n=1 Tax=Micromonospora sp. NBC_01412 TaxID=2903590 RepID=UPI003253F180
MSRRRCWAGGVTREHGPYSVHALNSEGRRRRRPAHQHRRIHPKRLRDVGKGTTAAATLASAVAARAYALSGQRDKAPAALTDADRLADHLPTDERTDSWFGHCEQKHRVHLSHALTALGETTRPRQNQAQAVALSAPTSALTRTLIRLDAAMCDHSDGNAIDGCHAATEALVDLPGRFRTDLTRKRALDLYREVPAHLRTLPEAQEFQTMLTP